MRIKGLKERGEGGKKGGREEELEGEKGGEEREEENWSLWRCLICVLYQPE